MQLDLDLDNDGMFTEVADEALHTHLTVCPYLPLHSEATKPHINRPFWLLKLIIHSTCHSIVELVKIGSIANLSFVSITGIGFIFLADDVTNYFIHIKGIHNAYIIHF